MPLLCSLPSWFFALPFALSPCLGFAPLFRRFIRLLLVQDCSGVFCCSFKTALVFFAPCSFHLIAVSSAVMPPRRTRNSLESSVPPAVSSAPPSTVPVSTNAVLTSVQASRSPTSASISPEFLAEVIQAIQTPISAIVQQSLSAAVGAHSVSQGLPAISAQGSSLATCAVHLDAHGSHQPWSSSAAAGFLPSTSTSSSPPVPVATPTNVSTGMLSSLVVPSFVPVFSAAPLNSIAHCSSVVHSLPATVNSALASQPIVCPTSVPSLTALPLQQPFVVGPGYSPVPFKVVSQITAGKFVNLEDLLAENITMPEQEPQLWFNGQLVLSHTPKKRKRLITDIASWMEAFSIFYLILCSSFPHRWRDLTSYKLLILRTYRQFSGFCWLDYDRAFREHAAAEKVTDWSKMHVQLFNYHTAGAQVRTRPASSSVVSSQAEASGNASSKVICHSWNAGHCIAVNPQCRFRHACSRCWGTHRATSCTSSQSSRTRSPDPDEPKRRKRH